ncbi:MAG: acetyl-CoA carboxylase biotin carboxyl carrier protein [Leptolyngbya sp. PLA1]|nr:acetyl-CoA carboxylase biotin carboxyl carrier protein [Leptolyngbya sp. PLA1]
MATQQPTPSIPGPDRMIDIKHIKDLVTLMKDNDLTEVDIKDGEQGICIRRGGAATVQAAPVQVHAAPAVQAAPAGPAPAAAPAPAAGQVTIDSPMVGTVYLAPNPDAAPFVKIGQRVSKDTVVCLIEAMKVFNEIKAEKDGVIEQILVSNSAAIEFGQKLFAIRP